MRIADVPEPVPHWPEKILELCQELPDAVTVEDRNRTIGRLWQLAYGAISRYARFHAHAATVDPDDLKDIASEKAIAFLQHAGEPAWTSGKTHPGQVCSYFSTLARNGLMDHYRRRRRLVGHEIAETLQETMAVPLEAHPENFVARRQFAGALHDCLRELSPKARLAWFLRVMLNMSSREIANHPNIRMNGTAVDMLLSRSRRVVRSCMQTKGFEAREIPPGTLAILWQSMHREWEDEP